MTQPVEQQTPPEALAAPAAPPWGADFDPARAWSTIQTLREAEKERNTLRAQVNELRPRADQFSQLEEASKSELQRLSEAAESAGRDAEMARSEAIRYKAAATHGISADNFDLLGSGTEEEVTARALRIAALTAAKVPTPPPAAPAARPVASLRPGATPGEAETEDDVIYAQLYGAQK